MPIVLANNREKGQAIAPGNTTVIEFNPWELGTFDPTIYGFAPLRYMGSNFTNGQIADNQRCVRGFDQIGFVMGTSSSLFNAFLARLDGTSLPPFVKAIFKKILSNVGEENEDIADWTPNPFLGFNKPMNPSANDRRLALVDGGEDHQNIPLQPLIQPLRQVDVIFAVDSSADTKQPASGWPNGTAIIATYQRSLNKTISNGTAFPVIPDPNTFVNLGLNKRPTFFGCDPRNTSSITPLIVYLPNAPYSYNSNVSTFRLDYNISDRNSIIQNGFNVATMGNGTADQQYPACIGCAILSRSFDRTKTPVPDACTQCFKKFCWDGTLNTTQPAPYDPTQILKSVKTNNIARAFPASLFASFMTVLSVTVIATL